MTDDSPLSACIFLAAFFDVAAFKFSAVRLDAWAGVPLKFGRRPRCQPKTSVGIVSYEVLELLGSEPA